MVLQGMGRSFMHVCLAVLLIIILVLICTFILDKRKVCLPWWTQICREKVVVGRGEVRGGVGGTCDVNSRKRKRKDKEGDEHASRQRQ